MSGPGRRLEELLADELGVAGIVGFERDLAHLAGEMGAAALAVFVHDWAEQLRELRRQAETRAAGNGNARLEWAQDVAGGHPANTYFRPAMRTYPKRGAGGLTAPPAPAVP